MTPMVDNTFQLYAENFAHKTPKVKFQTPITISVDTYTSELKFMFGLLQYYKTFAKDLTTDANYTMELLDVDNRVVWSSGSISDNGWSQATLTITERFPICGEYRVKWDWTTAQILAVGDLSVIFQLDI